MRDEGGLFCFTADGNIRRDIPPRLRVFISFMGLIVIASMMYLWQEHIAPVDIETYGEFKELKVQQPAVTNDATHTIQEGEKKVNKKEEHHDARDNGDFSTCTNLCETVANNRKEKFNGDLLDPKDVLRLAEKGFQKTLDSLKEDYGEEYYENIFYTSGTDNIFKYKGTKCATNDCLSYDRMKRKLKLKVLRMMQAIRTAESNLHGCDCVNKKGSFRGSSKHAAHEQEIPDFYESYVYANGGHSSAAGHGNLFNESYTAVAGRSMRNVWEAIGIEMIDRNYAMGGQGVSPFVSLCLKEVMGVDVDLLSWNSGMTDTSISSLMLYFYRGAVLKNRPALWGHDAQARLKKVGDKMEDIGLTILQTDLSEINSGFPDVNPNGIPMDEAERSKLPRFTDCQNCDGKTCGCDKWSCPGEGRFHNPDCACAGAKGKGSWHPGFRAHALSGHTMALGIIQMLLESLHEIVESNSDTESLLEELEAEESKLFEQFLEKPIDSYFLSSSDNFTSVRGTDFLHHAYTGPSICRTSMLPAESRFLGITTDTDKVGEISLIGKETYDVGTYMDKDMERGHEGKYVFYDLEEHEGKYEFKQTDKNLRPGEVGIMAPRSFRNVGCDEEIVMPDYKDWFYAPWNDAGKAFWKFPNKRERDYYGYDPEKLKGIIGLLFHAYEENYKAPRHMVSNADFTPSQFREQVRMKVNGKPVTSYRSISFGAREMLFLEKQDGDVYWQPSETSEYNLEFEAHGSGPFPPDNRIEPATKRHLRLYGIVLM